MPAARGDNLRAESDLYNNITERAHTVEHSYLTYSEQNRERNERTERKPSLFDNFFSRFPGRLPERANRTHESYMLTLTRRMNKYRRAPLGNAGS